MQNPTRTVQPYNNNNNDIIYFNIFFTNFLSIAIVNKNYKLHLVKIKYSEDKKLKNILLITYLIYLVFILSKNTDLHLLL